MNKVLVIDDEEGIRDVILMVLETHFDYEILEASSGNQGLATLKDDPNIGLILCDYRMDDGNGGDVFNYVKENCSHIPYVLVSTNEPDDYEIFDGYQELNDNNGYLLKPFSSEDLVKIVQSNFVQDYNLKEDGDEVLSAEEGTFFKVRSDRFTKYSGDYPVFIQLSKEKFVKIREKGDEGKDAINKYLSKGVNYFFLRAEDYNNFFTEIMEEIFVQLESAELSNVESSELQLNSIEQIHEFMKNLGVSEQTVATINQVVDRTILTFKKRKQFPGILKSFNGMEGYIYQHSHLTSYVACAIADKMDWKSASTWQKLVFSSLFQNIALDDSDLAKIFTINDDFFRSLKVGERKSIKEHMSRAISMLENVPEFSGEVRNAILNHHEQPDGTGFPRGLDSRQIGPMDALFIISVNFAHDMIIGGDDSPEKISQIAKSYEERFRVGNYKQAYEGLAKVFL